MGAICTLEDLSLLAGSERTAELGIAAACCALSKIATLKCHFATSYQQHNKFAALLRLVALPFISSLCLTPDKSPPYSLALGRSIDLLCVLLLLLLSALTTHHRAQLILHKIID